MDAPTFSICCNSNGFCDECVCICIFFVFICHEMLLNLKTLGTFVKIQQISITFAKYFFNNV